jgi:hypothetical protein
MVASEATRGDDEMGLLDEIASMGYAVRHVTPVKLTDAGCLTDIELDELRAIEGEETAITTTKHIAYVPVVSPLTESFGIGVADADSAGYVPIEDGYGTYEEARKAADQRNRECGISEKEATAVAICSMFRPGEYDDVLGTL